MQLSNKTAKAVAIIAAILMIASLMQLIAPIQTAEAQLAAQQPVSGPIPAGITVARQTVTRAFLSFEPNPIGVGQACWLTCGLTRHFLQTTYSFPKDM